MGKLGINEENQVQLAIAALRRAGERLDGDSQTCECCGLTVYHNIGERNRKRRYDSIINQLTKLIREG